MDVKRRVRKNADPGVHVQLAMNIDVTQAWRRIGAQRTENRKETDERVAGESPKCERRGRDSGCAWDEDEDEDGDEDEDEDANEDE